MLDQIIEEYDYEITFLKADGFDEAIIGVTEDQMRLVYSVTKVINILEQSMSTEDALDYYYFNIQDAYVGELTPIWCYDLFD
jgi:hypothetical protein